MSASTSGDQDFVKEAPNSKWSAKLSSPATHPGLLGVPFASSTVAISAERRGTPDAFTARCASFLSSPSAPRGGGLLFGSGGRRTRRAVVSGGKRGGVASWEADQERWRRGRLHAGTTPCNRRKQGDGLAALPRQWPGGSAHAASAAQGAILLSAECQASCWVPAPPA